MYIDVIFSRFKGVLKGIFKRKVFKVVVLGRSAGLWSLVSETVLMKELIQAGRR